MRVMSAVLLSLTLAGQVWAARSVVYQESQPIALRLEVNQNTYLVMPEPVDSVISALDPQTELMTDYKGPHLFIALKAQTLPPGRFFVLGKSGSSYAFTYKMAMPSDDIVHVLTAAPPTIKPVPFSLASWFRALRAGQFVPGSQPVDLVLPVGHDPRLQVGAPVAQVLGDRLAVSLPLQNLQAAPLRIDVRTGHVPEPPDPLTVQVHQWGWPAQTKVLAIAAFPEVLAPGQAGWLYAVLERRTP